MAGWESEDDCFTTTYFIDSYPQGDVQGILEQPDVTTGKSEVRNMTTYDYEQLFNELATLREASLAGHDEDAENS